MRSAILLLLGLSLLSCGPNLKTERCITQYNNCTDACAQVCSEPSKDFEEGLVQNQEYSGACSNCLDNCKKQATGCEDAAAARSKKP